MCIIASKPTGVEMPKFEILKECWKGNHDGAGIAYSRPYSKRVHIIKGLMTLKALNRAIKRLQLGKDDNVIIHFRFATHGLADKGNCHPFPISNKPDDLRALDVSCQTAVAHNGIFGTMPTHSVLSDTQKFIAKIMSDKYIIAGLDQPAVKELLSGYCGTTSKLAIIRPSGITHIGNFVENEGIFYSNYGFKSYTPISYDHIGWRGHFANDRDIKDIGTDKDNDYCDYCGVKSNITHYEDEEANLCEYCAGFAVPKDNKPNIIYGV